MPQGTIDLHRYTPCTINFRRLLDTRLNLTSQLLEGDSSQPSTLSYPFPVPPADIERHQSPFHGHIDLQRAHQPEPEGFWFSLLERRAGERAGEI